MTSAEASVDAGGNTVVIFDGCAKQRTPPASASQEVIASTRGARECPVGSGVPGVDSWRFPSWAGRDCRVEARGMTSTRSQRDDLLMSDPGW